MYERILVATDGSELSEQAVTSAIDLAILMNAELVAVKVVHHYPTGYFEGSMLLNQLEVKRLQEQADVEAQRVVDTVKEKAQAKGVKSTHAIVMKSELVSEAIIEAAANAPVRPDRDGLARPPRHQAPADGQRNAARADALAHAGAGAALSGPRQRRRRRAAGRRACSRGRSRGRSRAAAPDSARRPRTSAAGVLGPLRRRRAEPSR